MKITEKQRINVKNPISDSRGQSRSVDDGLKASVDGRVWTTGAIHRITGLNCDDRLYERTSQFVH